MTFLHPQYLALFYLLLALLPLWLYRSYYKRKMRLALGESRPLRKISRPSSLAGEVFRYLLVNLTLASLILALAHPQWIREKRVPHTKKMDIVFLLDTSPSMRASDIQPSRLERALEVVGNFAHNKLPHDRIGLVSFSSGSLILSYLTEDPHNILYYLDYLKEDASVSYGTNIGRAIQNGLAVITRDLEANPGTLDHKRVFILVSDGEDHGKELEGAVRAARRFGIRVHTIGIGSAEGAPIPIGRDNGQITYLEDESGRRIMSRFDEKTLRWVAEQTEGRAYRSFTGHELKQTFGEIVLKEREVDSFKRVIEHEDAYQTFLLAALGMFLAALLI